ncbi:hypothetical protein Leryth_026059 [Lithospermum erythrorhizon]|nr:hypothetical protein Leryth_026059 [Lithospermum erythrorhizon]
MSKSYVESDKMSFAKITWNLSKDMQHSHHNLAGKPSPIPRTTPLSTTESKPPATPFFECFHHHILSHYEALEHG